MSNRPQNLNDYQRYVLERFDTIDERISAVRADVARLQGRARAWGAVPGVIAVLIATVAFFK